MKKYKINLDYQRDVYDDKDNFLGHEPKIMKTIEIDAEKIKGFCKEEEFDNIIIENLERYLLSLLH